MKATNWIAAASLGVVVGAALVISCSDDSPGDVDAAVCDCPVAEPPLAGRIVSVRGSQTIGPASGQGVSASCPAGATFLGGACEVATDDPRILLMSSKVIRTGGGNQYLCTWSSLDATVANTITAEAICLVPAS